MTEPSVTVRPATVDERDEIEALLRENDLPVADLEASPVQLFVGVEEGDLVGVGGVEGYGDAGLLRSLVVPAEKRGRGYGSVLCDRLEERAAEAGIETLYLLTTTATDFFRDRGYDPVPRGTVPRSIRSTRQLTALCPESATCLWKRVASP